MAKHIRNGRNGKGKCSAGLRRSSNSMKKAAPAAVVQPVRQVDSTMRSAFDSILLKNIKASARAITKIVLSGLDRKVGLIGMGQGWNANLTNKTAKLLNAGVWDNPKAKMPYDRMVNG